MGFSEIEGVEMKQHYYPCDGPVDKRGYGKTACGRPGCETGGLIAWFFKHTDMNGRCKICHRRFKKDQREKTNQTPKIQ